MKGPLELAEQYWGYFAFTSKDALMNTLLSEKGLEGIWFEFPQKDWNQKQRAFVCFSIASRLDSVSLLINYLERIEVFLK